MPRRDCGGVFVCLGRTAKLATQPDDGDDGRQIEGAVDERHAATDSGATSGSGAAYNSTSGRSFGKTRRISAWVFRPNLADPFLAIDHIDRDTPSFAASSESVQRWATRIASSASVSDS